MGKQISSLSVALNATVAPFAGSLKGAEGAVHGLAGVVMGGFGAITGGVGSIVGVAASAGMSLLKLGGIGALVGAGFEAITDLGKGFALSEKLEKTQVQFSGLIGDSDKAKNAIADLTQFSKSTPFKLDSFIDASRELLAMGVNSDKLIPSLKAIGDVAAGVGQPLDEVTKIFGRVAEEGTLSDRSLREFAKAGIPVVDELAKKFGVQKTAIKGMAEAGQIGFRDLQIAFASMTGPAGKFGGAMEKQSHTLGGSLTVLQDSVELSLSHIADTLVDTLGLKDVLSSLNAGVEYMGGIFQRGLAYVGPIVKGFAMRTYETFAGLWTRIEPAVMRVWRGVGIAWGMITDVVTTAGGMVWDATVGVWDRVYGYVAPIVQSVWQVISDNWESVVTSTVGMGVAVWGYAQAYWGLLSDIASSVWDGITDLWVWGSNLVMGTTGTTGATVKDVFGGILDTTKSVMDGIGTAFNIGAFAITHWKDVVAIGMLSAELSVVTFGNKAEYFFTEVVPNALQYLAKNWTTILTDEFDFTNTIFSNLTGNIVRTMSVLPELIKGTMKFGDVWKPLTDGFETHMQAFVSAAPRVVGPLEAAMSNQLDGMKKSLGTGLFDYLGAQKSKASTAAASIISAINHVIKGSALAPTIKPVVKPPPPLKTSLDPDTLQVSIQPTLRAHAIRSNSAEAQALQFGVPRQAALAAAGAKPPAGGAGIGAALRGVAGLLFGSGGAAPLPAPGANVHHVPPVRTGVRQRDLSTAPNAGDAAKQVGLSHDFIYWAQRIELNTRQPTDPDVVSIG